MNDALYIAVDLGAGSGRVCLVGFGPGELLLEEVRRFRYPPTLSAGHLRWDFSHIFDEVKNGIRLAADRARDLDRPVRSIGVDSWGVDYGLINAGGKLIEQPICYRDERTLGVMDQVFRRAPREEIFRRTGIQFLTFNTLFQLYAHAQAGIPNTAAKLLLIPDLINFLLTGNAVTESSNATTTQLVNAQSQTWEWEMISSLDLPGNLLPEIIAAGADLGTVRPDLAVELRVEGVRVVAPATHDTGSAVAGTPLQEGWAYISSGTWSLVGIELEKALINSEVAFENFTNEGGAFGTTRFLKNVTGLWILECCRSEWKESGVEFNYDKLPGPTETIEPSGPLIFPDDPRFLKPPSMLVAMSQQLAEREEYLPQNPTGIARMILNSLALRYASVLRTMERLTDRTIKGVQIVGGGSQNDYLSQATANAAGRSVLAGPVEATVTGNALVQAIAAGQFQSLAEARHHVALNTQLREFTPHPSRAWEEAAHRYAKLEAGTTVTYAF